MSVAQPTTYSGYIIGQRLTLKDVRRSCGELTWCFIGILALMERGKPQKPLRRLPHFDPQFEIGTSNIGNKKILLNHP
jgi:hypothetical protein